MANPTAKAFLIPNGLINPSTAFPGETTDQVELRINAFLSDATGRTTGLAADVIPVAIEHWVYFRLFQAIYLDMLGTPNSSAITDEGSAVYLIQQINGFKALAEEHYDAFNTLLGTGTVAPDRAAPPPSVSVSHRIAYN